MKNVIVSGATGFVGSSFVESFEQEYKIIGLSRSQGFNPLSLADYDRCLGEENPDVFIHMGGPTSPLESREIPHSYFEDHLRYAMNVCEFVRVHKIPHLIYLNTYVYGNPQYLPIDEEHPLSLISPYHQAKMTVEDLMRRYLENSSTTVTSFRVFNVYGKGQSSSLLLSSLMEKISNGVVEVTDLEPRRDFIYIKDLIDLMKCAVETEALAERFNVFNVGYGKSYSVHEVIQNLEKVLNKNVEVRNLNQRRSNEVMDCVANISKATEAFDWLPKYDLREGLMDMLEGGQYV